MNVSNFNEIKFRSSVKAKDEKNISNIVSSTGYFYEDEINIAVELASERLQKGDKSGYYFIFADVDQQTIGYTCFGPIPATKFSYDLYWIAVHADWREKGIGKKLLQKSEEAIVGLGGRRIYIETSGRELYQPTRAFYLACGYKEEAVFTDFYAPGDAKYVYLKVV